MITAQIKNILSQLFSRIFNVEPHYTEKRSAKLSPQVIPVQHFPKK